MNEFFVGVQGDKIKILGTPNLVAGLTKAQALNLAAWLVLMSMADEEEFKAVLEAESN